MKCVYCKINDAGNSEHVFTYGLGGGNVYMDCVCDKCNGYFSELERELIQKSHIALMRSSEGIEGYKKNRLRPAPLKYPEIFQHVKEANIIYELGVYQGVKPFMRPQIIQKDSNLYIEGGAKEEVDGFIKVFTKWQANSLIAIHFFPDEDDGFYEGVIFKRVNDNYTYEPIKLQKIKDIIDLQVLEADKEDFRRFFEPRIFLTDDKKLVVRALSISEGQEFILNLLSQSSKPDFSLGSYPVRPSRDAVNASFNFNEIKLQQALVKIGLNALMYYYPALQHSELLKPAIDFIFNGGSLNASLDKKNDLLDIDEKSHTILFFQRREGIQIRINLFAGQPNQWCYSVYLNGVEISNKIGIVSEVMIDYINRKNKFFSSQELAARRAKLHS